ncbi:Monogalactosyldiacylglycerol synthase [Gracilaria domingensis]|nr:Monogalactosyldiacylglycerol synthase [Gracilaria domingensis]
MVVHPRFYNRLSSTTRKQQLARLNLHQHDPTVLILFGGAPPTDTVMELVKRFSSRPLSDTVNVIAVCGSNSLLLDRLTRWKRGNPNVSLCITGFTDQIPLLMQVSDVLVGKPGPGVVSEAFVSALPLILITGDSGAKVMKQEQDVLHWVCSKGIASVVHSCEQAAAVTLAQISQMREAIDSMEVNNAVFEVRDLILSKLGLCTPTDTHRQRLQQAHQLQSQCSTTETLLSPYQQQHQQISREREKPVVSSIPTNQTSRSVSETCCSVTGSPREVSSRRHTDSRSPTTITALPSRAL